MNIVSACLIGLVSLLLMFIWLDIYQKNSEAIDARIIGSLM
jgi:hypothetical protein